MKFSSIAFAFLLVASLCLAAPVPEYQGMVNDYAHVIGQASVLENELRTLEQEKGVEFAIVTLTSLPADETKESYSYKIFNTWKIGKSDADNGLLLLLIANQSPGNRLRMEVGYGLEGDMPDAAAGRILDLAIPSYEAGNYTAAVWAVVNGVETQLNGYEYSQSSEAVPVIAVVPIIISIIIFALIGIMMALPRCPKCGSTQLECKKERCKCKQCGFRFKKKRKAWPYMVAGTMGGGYSGGGFGGFGGGASGGGGAGR